ncbi:MAG: hypothetical protein KIT11_00415 [Fimbriimonadaceae bacterium]|nr:hypothetical protein [Fimbriimonadaceae bacterium]QYK55164.1 MAG: hypothetical protein KF733_09120 [Fimbriimonadaceae bacterium]
MAKIAYSALVEEVRGKIGTIVFSAAEVGPTVRIKASVKNPKTNGQRAIRSYLSKAAKTFENMTSQQAAAWNAFGKTQQRSNPVTGESYTLSGISAFVELAVKFLQIAPNGSLPLAPPTTDFTGDTITVSATAGTGQITFTGSGPNSLGVTTEFLIQRLPSRNRRPNPEGYASAGFKVLATNNLDFVATVPAGFYAVGYRFVRTGTGQATDIVTLPLQTVALSVEDSGQVPSTKKKAA